MTERVPPVLLREGPAARGRSTKNSICTSQTNIFPGRGAVPRLKILGNMLFGARKEKTAQFALDPL